MWSPSASTVVPEANGAPSRVAVVSIGAVPPVVAIVGVTARAKTAPSSSGAPLSRISIASGSPPPPPPATSKSSQSLLPLPLAQRPIQPAGLPGAVASTCQLSGWGSPSGQTLAVMRTPSPEGAAAIAKRNQRFGVSTTPVSTSPSSAPRLTAESRTVPFEATWPSWK